MGERIYCGKEGRQARAQLREAISGSLYYLYAKSAANHVDSCSSCRGKIQKSLAQNPRTIYKTSDYNAKDVDAVLLDIPRRYYLKGKEMQGDLIES